jgi:hypothetical protein
VAPDGDVRLEFRAAAGNGPGFFNIVTCLLGDSYDALEILVYALHFLVEKVPRVASFDRLWELVVLCDKYDCASAIAPWAREPPQVEDNFSKCLIKEPLIA